jgi:flagellar biosynthesis/type III secretory pathway protein FliH
LGPDDIPRITSADEARANPALAVLSCQMHGNNRTSGAKVAAAAMEGTRSLDEEDRKRYVDLILANLNRFARAALEAEMQSRGYEYKSHFARKYVAQGERQGLAKGIEKGIETGIERGVRQSLLDLIEARGIPLSAEQRARIESEAGIDRLRAWLRRAAVSGTATEVLSG